MGKVKVNGERYLGLADEAVRAGPGGMRSLSAWLEQQLRSDLLWLAERGSQVSWSPLCTDSDGSTLTGHRPHASVDWSSILCLPWIVQPGLKRITFSHQSALGIAAGLNPGALQRLRLLGLSPKVDTVLLTGGLVQQDIETALATPAPRRMTTSLVWEIKSGIGEQVAQTSGDGAALSLNRLDAGSSNTTFYRDYRTGTHPSTSDLGIQASFDTTAEGVPSQAFDHLYTREGELYTTPWEARRMTVRSAGVLRAPGRITRRRLAYLQTRGGEIREHYDASLFHRPRERYLAHQAVEGKDSQAHLLALRSIHTRARCRWAGPVGERIEGEPDRALWPTGYVRRHVRAQHDGSSNPNVLFWAPVRLSTKNPRVTVLLNLLAVQLLDITVADRDELDAKSGSARWVLDVQVMQYQDGTASPQLLASLTSEQAELVHYVTDTSGQWTALLQERARAVESLEGYTYKEGQLYEEDYALLQRLELTLNVPFDPAGADPWPVLVRVGVKYVSGSQVRAVEPPDLFDISIDEASDLELVCVGATIWEEPKL